MRYVLEVLTDKGVFGLSADIDLHREHNLRFWTGIHNNQFSGECVVMGDAATFKEFVRVFDPERLEEFSAWAGPERCRLVITQ